MGPRLLPGPAVLVGSMLCLLACVGGLGVKLLHGSMANQRAAVAAQTRALAAVDPPAAPSAASGAGQVQGTSASSSAPSTCTARLRDLVSALDAAGRQARIGLSPRLDEAIAARAALESASPRCPRADARTAVRALATYVDAQSAPESSRPAAWTRAAQDVARVRRQLAARG